MLQDWLTRKHQIGKEYEIYFFVRKNRKNINETPEAIVMHWCTDGTGCKIQYGASIHVPVEHFRDSLALWDFGSEPVFMGRAKTAATIWY